MRWHALLCSLLALTWAHAALAQETTDELDEGVVMETPFILGIENDTWEAGLLIGYLGLNQTMLDAKNVVVDIETPNEMLFADMKIEGEFGFAPKLMINRSFGRHFVLENSLALAFGNFKQSVAETRVSWELADSENDISENEIETGSYFAMIHDHSLTWYPRGEGRLQPYLSAGAGTHWFELDSDYVAGSLAGGFGFSYGLGLRVVGDDLYSFRIELRNHHSKVEYDVADVWRNEQNVAGTAILDIPVLELVDASTLTAEEIDAMYAALQLPRTPDPQFVPQPLESLDSQNYTSLFISIGFSAAF